MRETGRRAWRTSSYTDAGNSCVEVAPIPGGVLVRDTKDAGAGPILELGHHDWAALLAGAPGSLRVEEREAVTVHAGARVPTRWHLTDGAVTLHFTDAEWAAFRAGVEAGEFEFAPA